MSDSNGVLVGQRFHKTSEKSIYESRAYEVTYRFWLTRHDDCQYPFVVERVSRDGIITSAMPHPLGTEQGKALLEAYEKLPKV